MTIEVDGQWGPYLLCNPVNNSEPLGEWNCTTGITQPKPEHWPEQCSAKLDGYPGICY